MAGYGISFPIRAEPLASQRSFVEALADAAPGRVDLGVGSSSEFFVSMHNARPFERPFHQTRDVVRFLERALSGEKASGEYDTFSVRGFTLRAPKG
jgi:alkanesulfonate monooxygenase SsuD/methylene tetrahydromethanopterin reductase-like flavin-dependent oxidoreductase (luciferase family)